MLWNFWMATTDSFCSNLDIKRKLVEESYCRYKFSFRFFALSSQSDANTYLTISVKMSGVKTAQRR